MEAGRGGRAGSWGWGWAWPSRLGDQGPGREEVRTGSKRREEVPEWALGEFFQVMASWEGCWEDQYLSPLDRREYLWAQVISRGVLFQWFY